MLGEGEKQLILMQRDLHFSQPCVHSAVYGHERLEKMKLITPSGAKHSEQKGKGEGKKKKGNINGQCSLLHTLVNRQNARTVYPTRYIIRHYLLPSPILRNIRHTPFP